MLLDMVQRSDVLTVVRCAATHKLLRRAILASPALRRRIRVDPEYLLGFSFWQHGGGRGAMDTPPPLPTAAGGPQRFVRLDDAAITGFVPVAWRDGLLVVGRFRGGSHDLRVCNVLTGDVTASLPPFSLPAETSPSLCSMSWRCPRSYALVLLTAGRSFELLVANTGMQTQVFSSDRWEWGPVRHTSFPQHQHHPADLHYRYFSRPAVIGRTIHWLCSVNPLSHIPGPGGHLRLRPEILSLDVGAAEATFMEVARYCFSDLVYRWECQFDTRALLTAVRGQLCLFVLEKGEISACTIVHHGSEPPTWSRQYVITRPELQARADLDPHGSTKLRLHAYGESSGSMILEVSPCVFLRLDIGEGFTVARVFRLIVGTQDTQARSAIFLAFHEIHMVSLLQDMKSFTSVDLVFFLGRQVVWHPRLQQELKSRNGK